MATAFQDQYALEGDQLAAEQEMQDALASIVQDLQALADDQVTRKGPVEQRWLDNLRAFHGRYDEATETSLAGNKGKSRAYVKITRKKTNSWEARLSSLLFPTDDENWDARPTPVSSLHELAKAALQAAQRGVETANQQAASGDPMAAQASAAAAQEQLTVAQQMQANMEEAVRRGEAMKREMKDQLVECDYAAEARRLLRDGCRLGTGIIKGPLAGERQRGKWVQMATPDGGSAFVYDRETDPAPIYKWVDPWSYFPDMSAIRPEDREFEFERHLWSAKDLKALVRDNGFNASAVRDILRERTRGQVLSQPGLSALTSLRGITGTTDAIKDRFVGWEYHGPLSAKQVAVVLKAMGREEEAIEYETVDDPLAEVRVICFFCEGKVLKLSATWPLDSNESLYSMWTFEEAESSIFGYGIPEIMSDSQKSMNGAWRMALDNAGLSVGPQVFIDRESITPANGSWELTPRKVWYKKKGIGMPSGPVLEVQNIPNNVTEIMNLVEVSRRFIDDETALPVQAEGELTDNPNITATATNFMSMASNVTFRRVVKNFDDGVTTPTIRRLYDWNMQHNKREDIKGDMKVDARGSSALLQRELQAQMLLNVAQNWTSHPTIGAAIKTYDAIAETLKASMIQPETVMVSKEQFEADLAAKREAEAAAAQQPPEDPQNNPTVIAANVRMQAAQIDADSRIQVAEMQRQTELMQMAQKYNLDIEKLATLMDIKDMELSHKENQLAVEAALEDARAQDARARGEEPRGSGGAFSA